MTEADGPTRLLALCGQRLSRFLRDAEQKHLAWLREAEEQGVRMLDSNFGAEPELMSKTPSQRRRPKKRVSSCLKEDNKELSRRRLSRRRSSIKPGCQRRRSKEPPPGPSCRGEAAPTAGCSGSAGLCPAPAPAPVASPGCQGCPRDADGSDTPRLHDVSSATAIPTAREEEEEEEEEEGPEQASTSTPRAARNGDPAVLRAALSPRGLEGALFQDSDSRGTSVRSKARRCSGRRSLAGGLQASRRASLAEKCSLVSKRESMIRRSISKAVAKKAAAAWESSASSRVSCQNSLEVFVEEDVASSMRPGLELNPPREKTPEDVPVSSRSIQATSSPAQHPTHPEQWAGDVEGSRPQTENQEQLHCAKSQENPAWIWTRSCKQAVGVLWNGPQPGGRTPSPLDDKHKNSANQTPAASSPASKVVRPLKNFLQAVQRNQLLMSPGPTGHGGVIKNLIRHNTPTRPDVKGDFVERERQRLESLRKKQEAEEQRKKKVEEEKRRRQAEMKQKREERLRKALQARERVEQMEEEKKKRMEQKILQHDEKAREEKAAEERSKKKTSKKLMEADARKQKALKGEDEFEQQGPLQKKRGDEVKEKGKKVLELKNLLEQQQVEHMRDHKQQWKEKAQVQLESAAFTEKNIKERASPKELHQLPEKEKRAKQLESSAVASNPWLRVLKEKDGLQEPQKLGEEKRLGQTEALSAGSGTWLNKTVKRSITTTCLRPLKGTKESRSPKVNENNYGMDLNSDDSTDDENEPRKPVPAWADGSQLNQAILHQYYHPVNVDQIFGLIPSPKLEDIFGKSKPRYFKRTSSAVWHSPPEAKATCGLSCNLEN